MTSATPSLVLVVEDEPIIRIMATEIVEAAGLIAVDAADALEAITILQSRRDIRIVFADINMPGGIDGLQLASIVRERWPLVELILASGRVPRRDVELPARTLFFQKPYRADDVINALRRLGKAMHD
jgi:CheY-like chemotaxis protein